MKPPRPSRRDVLFGLGGVLVGGAVATAAGLAYREYRRRRGSAGPPNYVRPPADDGWLINADERRAASSGDALVSSADLDIRDAVDIPGGDYEAFHAGGLSECVSACEADENCRAFTYARSTHFAEDKRGMCWLKSGDTQPAVENAAAYVSGRRGGW